MLYATKSFLQVTLHALEALNTAELAATPRRVTAYGPISFRAFSEIRVVVASVPRGLSSRRVTASC